MVYRLQELLTRLGTPNTLEKKHVEWHYFDTKGFDLAGYAEVRMEDSNGRLVAEIRHSPQEREDDQGFIDAQFTQAFYMSAALIGRDMYTITKMRFHGREYLHPSRAIADAGFDMFHTRTNAIHILPEDQASDADDKHTAASTPLPHERLGVVIPFRPRQPSRISRAM